MAKSTFRNSRSTFYCVSCCRLTRETEDNSGLDCCPQCSVAAMHENGINDYGSQMTPEEFAATQLIIDKSYNEAVKKGGVVDGYPKVLNAAAAPANAVKRTANQRVILNETKAARHLARGNQYKEKRPTHQGRAQLRQSSEVSGPRQPVRW